MDSAKREDNYKETTSEGGIGPVSRRKVLEGIGVAGVSLLAGCSNNENSTETSDQTDESDQGTTQNGETETGTDPLEQTHRAERLNDVVQELEQDTVTLNLQPADPDAEYANSTIFSDYNGQLNVEIELNEVFDQRRFNNPVMDWPVVQDFYENAHDPEWRQETHETYIEEANGENIFGLKEEIDWDLYMNGETLDERFVDSGVHDLWYKHTVAHPDTTGISSVHNGMKAMAYQALEHEHGHNTLIWGHESQASRGGHGLIAAVENPTRDPEQTNQQQTYTIETNYQPEQQIANVEESNFFKDSDEPVNADVQHPADPDYNDAGKKNQMYLRTGKATEDRSELYQKIRDIPDSLGRHFAEEWFRNPESEPALKHFDRTNTAAYIAEEAYNMEKEGGQVSHTAEEIRFETQN